MIVERLLSELESRGATLVVRGDRLRVKAPRGAISAELLAELRARKSEVIDLMLGAGLSSTHEHSPLRLKADQEVWTPRGRGQVIAALPDRVVVTLPESDRLALFLPAEVRPLNGPDGSETVPTVMH